MPPQAPCTLAIDLDTLEPIDPFLTSGPITTADSNAFFVITTEIPGQLSLVNSLSNVGYGTLLADGSGAARYSPSDGYVFGVGDGVQVWNRITREPLSGLIEGNAGAFEWSNTVTQVYEGRAHVWNNEPETWGARACELVGRNFTAAEWEQHMPAALEYRRTCEQYPLG